MRRLHRRGNLNRATAPPPTPFESVNAEFAGSAPVELLRRPAEETLAGAIIADRMNVTGDRIGERDAAEPRPRS